jgi:hypothetical protein
MCHEATLERHPDGAFHCSPHAKTLASLGKTITHRCAALEIRRNVPGGTTTADYRAFYIGSDGNFLKNVDLDCASYDTAIKEAQQLADHNGIEPWGGPRMVATLDHKSE